MDAVIHHAWDMTPTEAVALQKELAGKVLKTPLEFEPRLIAGTDVSYDIGSDQHIAVVVVLSYPELKVVDSSSVVETVTFPYIPGLLSFREIPALLKAFEKLKTEPDLIFCDGQGVAHPRRLGIAAHLGVVLNHPCVGVAKSVLCGHYEMPEEKKGSVSPLVHRGEVIGEAVRTKDGVSPVFVSVGHRMMQKQAREYVLKTVTKYRIPEPTRQAHLLANQVRRSLKQPELIP